jgi:riboflavin synthase
MFTGLIEEVGTAAAVRHSSGASRLVLSAPAIGPDCRIGESVSINGVCLTVVAAVGPRIEFDAVAETLRRSNLGELRPGDLVNLERALAAGGRFGGHIVQGHVDAAGRIVAIVPEATSHMLTIEMPGEIAPLVVEKGSIAVDGISLTVAALTETTFTVAIIPHTWAVTTLSHHRRGDRVNLEADVLAKYVDRLLEARFGRLDLREPESASTGTGLTEPVLRDHGFA